MPHFAQPLPLWDLWLHNYQERQVRKVKAAAKAPLAKMRRCFRTFRMLAAFALRKRLALEKAQRHFRRTCVHSVLRAWRDVIAEPAYHKKLQRTVLSAWRQYAHRKRVLRPHRQSVVQMRLRREQHRAWAAWRHVQLRSCFQREFQRARLLLDTQWQWKVRRLLLVWLDLRAPLRKWRVFTAWRNAVRRRKLFLTLRVHCNSLRRRHLLYGVFGAWKAVVWKQEDEFLEDRLQLSAWDAYKELSPLMPMLFYGCFSDAAAIFGGVAAATGSSSSEEDHEDVLVKRQRELAAFHTALVQGSVVEARNLILQQRHLVNGVDARTGNTALHVVAGQVEERVRRLEILSLLLSEGACTWDTRNRHGLTPAQLVPVATEQEEEEDGNDDARRLLARGVYGFHSSKNKNTNKTSSSDFSTGLAEARLAWCLVARMASELVRGTRLPGDDDRGRNAEWHSVLREELWLRQGRVSFASQSSFSPAIQRCRAFLNGMKHRVGRSKDDVLAELYTALCQRGRVGGGAHGGGARNTATRPMLIKSGTRRMLSRDLARMEEKIDLLSWLKNTPDDPTRETTIRQHAQDDENEELLFSSVRALGEYGAYAETILSPVLHDEAMEQQLVQSFVGVVFALGFPVECVLTEAMRLEDECTRLEAAVLESYQATMRVELRCRSPEQPRGLPLLRLFTEAADVEFFFKKELLDVNVELLRRVRRRHGLQKEGKEEEGKEEERSVLPSVAQLLLEMDVLLAKAQRKERKVAKKLEIVQQSEAALSEANTRVLLRQQQTQTQSTQQRITEITDARMRLESERLRFARVRLKQIEWANTAKELVVMKQSLLAAEQQQEKEEKEEKEEEPRVERVELVGKKQFLETQLALYLRAIKTTVGGTLSATVVKGGSGGSGGDAAVGTELRRLHKTMTAALSKLLVANLFRSGWCWLVENLANQLHEENEAEEGEGEEEETIRATVGEGDNGMMTVEGEPSRRSSRKKTTVLLVPSANGSAVAVEIAEPVGSAVINSFAAARKASAAIRPGGGGGGGGGGGVEEEGNGVGIGGGGGGGGRRRSSVANARGVLDTLHRSSAATDLAEIHTAMMRENYTASSQLLFESDRDALHAEEERVRRQDAERTQQQQQLYTRHHGRLQMEPVEERNPITGELETPSSRLLSDKEMAAMAAAAAVAVTIPQLNAAATRQKTRKREQLRQVMMQRQLQRLAAGATDENENDARADDVAAAEEEKGGARRERTRGGRGAAAESVVDGDLLEMGFGNFVAGDSAATTSSAISPLVSLPPPHQQPTLQHQQQRQAVARVASSPSTPTDTMLAAISAESLWKRGGAGRRQGAGGSGATTGGGASAATGAAANGSTLDLFASAEDEEAFNTSFRVMSAAKERRTTPTGTRRLSAISIVAGGGVSVGLGDLGGDSGGVSAEERAGEKIGGGGDENEPTHAVEDRDDVSSETLVAEQQSSLLTVVARCGDGWSGGAATADAIAEECAAEEKEEEGEERGEKAKDDQVQTTESLPPRVDFASVMSAAEETVFFDQTLQLYLDRVRRDSLVSVSSSNAAPAPLLPVVDTAAVEEMVDTWHDGNSGGADPVPAAPPLHSTPTRETTEERTLRAPYIKWEPEASTLALSAVASAPPAEGGDAGTTEEHHFHHRPLVVESTRLLLPSPAPPTSAPLARELRGESTPSSSSSTREDHALREALAEIERQVEEDEKTQKQQQQTPQFVLSGKSFAMRVRQRRASTDAAQQQPELQKQQSPRKATRKSKSTSRACVESPASLLEDQATTAHSQAETETQADAMVGERQLLLLSMSPSVPKISVTIQRKTAEATSGSAAAGDDDATIETKGDDVDDDGQLHGTVPTASTTSLARLPSLPTLCELSIQSNKATNKQLKQRKPSSNTSVAKRRQSQMMESSISEKIRKPSRLSVASASASAVAAVAAPPLAFCLEGASAISAAPIANPSVDDDAGKPMELPIPQLSEDQKRGVWRDFTAVPLTDAMQDAYAQLYPHLYEPATPVAAIATPSSDRQQLQRRVSVANQQPTPVNVPLEKQIEMDKRFWSAVEGYKTLGVAGLIPLDEKTAKTRRQDCAVAIYQQFLRPGVATRLVWLGMYADELRAVEKRLLLAPVGIFDTLQQTAQLHISTLKSASQQQQPQ